MKWWVRLQQTFWFLPAVLCTVSVILAELLISVDQRIQDADLGPLAVLITRVGESGSRDLLGAIAGSMLTVASTTFSITIAVLALSSSTYGPRLVRNFMANRGNQFVLGVFVATFLYSLMVLRSIRVTGGNGEVFVPHLAVNVAMLLAVLAIGVLVYFIHHISDSVQVWTLAVQVRDDLVETVDRLYPESIGRDRRDVESDGDENEDLTQLPDGQGSVVAAQQTGYVQSVNRDDLVSLAAERDVVVSLNIRPGQHVVEGARLATVWPSERADDDVLGGVRTSIGTGRARSPYEDVEFGVLLLEEMAVRALSPSTNDPYTAINALDQLAAGLIRFTSRRNPSPRRYDSEGKLRVVAPAVSLTDVLDHVLDAMRLYAAQHPSVLHRTIELVDQVGAECADRRIRARLEVHVQLLTEAFSRTSPQLCDLEALNEHASKVLRELRRPLEKVPD